jgi:hypothetical protein
MKTYPISDYLSNSRSISSHILKRRLIEESIKSHCCENCSLTLWLGEPIPIELHHEDGNNKNNNLQNLKILCPNCHSIQPNTHRGKTVRPIKKVKKTELENAIKTSKSLNGLLRILGASTSGSNYKYIRLRIKELNISCPFLEKASIKIINNFEPYANPKKCKILWPNKEEFQLLLWEKPTTEIARILGISDAAISKFCTKNKLTKPPRGYWAKKAQ